MFTIRRAVQEDVENLTQARVDFYREGKTPSAAAVQELADANRNYFQEYLPRDDFAAWIAEADGAVIAVGAIVYFTLPPRPTNLSGKVAYLLQMYTTPTWRRRGVGSAILTEIIDSVKRTDARCILLYAMADGRHLYERAGFQYRPDNMQLVW